MLCLQHLGYHGSLIIQLDGSDCVIDDRGRGMQHNFSSEQNMRAKRFDFMFIAIGLIGMTNLFCRRKPRSPATAPTIDIWHEPTDVPTIKINEHGVPNADFMKMHRSFVKRQDRRRRPAFPGDSITNGWFWSKNNQNNKDIWNAHFGKYNPANFGIGGDRTEHVLWRIENGELDGIKPKAVVLLIGTNNIGYPAADILKGVEKVVEEIHTRLPDSKLLLVAIFPRGADPKDPKVADMREKIKTVNESLAKLDDGQKTRYLDIADKLLSPDGSLSKDIMPDALHLNYAGYTIWADTMQPLLDEMMK